MTRCHFLFLIVLFLAPRSLLAGSDPSYAFEPGSTNLMEPKNQAWHREFESNGSYGESWYFISQTAGGGVLFAMLGITNMGLNTFDASCDAQYYGADGKTHRLHKEYKREDIQAAKDKMDVKVGACSVWRAADGYHMRIQDAAFELNLAIQNTLPAVQVGGGSIYFYEDRSAQFSVAFHVPAGKTSGSLSAGGRTYDLAGDGYHDHGFSTIKIPSFLNRWYCLRVFNPAYSFVLHQLFLNSKFGEGQIKYGVVGSGQEQIGILRQFWLQPQQWREDEESGQQIPTKFKLRLDSGGYSVEGMVEESKFLDSIDVLAVVSWPVRMAIKAFYASPYMVRRLVQYELEVKKPDGNKERLSGTAVLETNYF